MGGMKGSPLGEASISEKVMGLSKLPSLPSYAQNILGGGALGVVSGLTSPEAPTADTSEYLKEKAKTTGLSALLGSAFPIVGETVKGINKGLGLNIGLKPSVNVPTKEDLLNESTQLFNVAKQSGVQVDANRFASAMDNIGRSLRAEGYTPTGYPKIGRAHA